MLDPPPRNSMLFNCDQSLRNVYPILLDFAASGRDTSLRLAALFDGLHKLTHGGAAEKDTPLLI